MGLLELLAEPLLLDHLLGVSGDTVYLAGDQVCALRKPDGLASDSRFVLVWTFQLGRDPLQYVLAPRSVLTADSILVPDLGTCRVLARADGELRGAIGLEDGGNVVAAEDALFVLSREGLRRIPR